MSEHSAEKSFSPGYGTCARSTGVFYESKRHQKICLLLRLGQAFFFGAFSKLEGPKMSSIAWPWLLSFSPPTLASALPPESCPAKPRQIYWYLSQSDRTSLSSGLSKTVCSSPPAASKPAIS